MLKKERKLSGTTSEAVSPREAAHKEISRKAAEAGIVLLKNEGGVLPVSTDKPVALFGSGAAKTVKGGTGSGDVNERESISIYDGMTEAGYTVLSSDWLEGYKRIYKAARESWRDIILNEGRGANLTQFFEIYASHPFEMPSGDIINQKYDTDLAIYVVSRVAGEAADRTLKKGDYYLTDNELRDLEFLCSNYENIVLLINTGAPIELSFLDRYENIKSVLYIGQPGMEGGRAVANVLCGRATPGGKLTDTWAKDYYDYPCSRKFSYLSGDSKKAYYSEGIYVGYRYFDSFGIKPRFGFGFGLSYTDFKLDYAGLHISKDNKEITLSVNVKNTGDYSGREVVQVYAGVPAGRLLKEKRRLVGFSKTGNLGRGESQTLEISFGTDLLSSFDTGKNAWLIESGIYTLWMGNSLEGCSPVAGLLVNEDVYSTKYDAICPLKETLDEMCPDEDEIKKYHSESVEFLKVNKMDIHEIKPEFGENVSEKRKGSVITGTLAGIAEELDDEELIHMVVGEITKGQDNQGEESALGSSAIMIPGAAGETSSILEEKYGIGGLPMADGPAGLRLKRKYLVSSSTGTIVRENPFSSFEDGYFVEAKEIPDTVTYYQYCTAIPVGVVIAGSWDREMIKEVGEMIGAEMKEFGVAWWLAPGMNIHRNPLCGRNFEYYSEDPVLTGIIASAMTEGVQSHNGIGVTIKHFACNNQEDNRMSSDSIVSERALREIYLKGFEIAVKSAKPMCIMTSYNMINGVHSANSYDLCTKVARDEWGFDGIIMTDWTTTAPHGGSIAYQCIEAGNDLIMPGFESDYESLRNALKSGELSREKLKESVKRIIHAWEVFE